jgi:hypothetical protein
MHTRVLTRNEWETIQGCLSTILVMHLSLLHVAPLFLNNYFMFHLFAKICYLSVNLLMITLFFEFHSSFFVIKDCRTKSILHQGPLKKASISCCLLPPLFLLHTLLLVKGLPLINGTNAWVTLLYALLSK